MAESPIRLTRPELYRRIWTTPVSRVAPEFGISDVGLRKICQEFDIPLPPAGYWAKKQHGKRVKQKPLCPIEGLDDEYFEFAGPEPENERSSASPEAIAFDQKERLAENRIAVAEVLDAPHPLVDRTMRGLKNPVPNEHGLVEPRTKRCLDVAVSPELLDRAMRIIDAVVKSLEARGLRVTVDSGSGKAAIVKVLGERLRFRLEEVTDRRERELTEKEKEEARIFRRVIRRYHRVPTGRLSICITNAPVGIRHRWSDSGRQPLESLLNAFVRGLVGNAEGLKRQRILDAERRREFEAQQQKWREEAERKRLEEQRRSEDERRFEHLEELAARCERSQRVRLFLDAVEASAVELGHPSRQTGRF